MIKLLALDMDGTLLNEAKEIQAHITAIHKLMKGASNWFYVQVAAFRCSSLLQKTALDLRMSMSLSITVAPTHQTSDWSLVDWQELSPADIEYLYDLAEKGDVS